MSLSILRILARPIAAICGLGAPLASAQSVSMQCEQVFSGPYDCEVSTLPPLSDDHVEAILISDPTGVQPSYYVALGLWDDTADVHISFDGGPWIYHGIWEQADQDGDCLAPREAQAQEVLDRLVQDAWRICVY